MNIAGNTLSFPMRPLQRKNARANDIITEIAFRFKDVRKQLPPDKVVDLTCCIDGQHFSINNIGIFGEEFVYILAQSSEEMTMIYAPVEQISFFITVTNKTDSTVQREIGFDAISKQREQ